MDALKSPAARFAAFIVAMGTALAHAQQASEQTVKAAFLYKFAGYVEWPASAFPSPDTPVVIGVSGNDEVAAELEKLVPGRKINSRAVLVRRLREGEAPTGAHLVFVGRGESNPRNVIRAAQQAGALVVTESERGLEQGAAINFVPIDDRIGFEVSLESAERSGVRLSSRMLGVARRVVAR
jgi:hypothetical protein